MTLEIFFEKFDQFADVPNAVAKMRELVLDLAVQGKLVERQPSEGDGLTLLKKLRTLPPEMNSKSRTPKELLIEPDAQLEIPSHWALTTVENTTRGSGFFCDGDWVESKDQDPDGDVRLIQLADVGDGLYRNRSSRFMTKNAATRLNCSYLKVGDILIARMPDPLGRCCRFPGDPKPAVTVVDVCILRPNVSFFDPDFLVVAINGPGFRRLVSDQATGTTRSRISRSNLGVLPIPLPPLAEQKRIVAKVDELMSLCHRLEVQQQERETRHIALARAALARFAEAPSPANLDLLFHTSYTIPPADIRKSILTLAVQGKLVAQDPNDEPACSLLSQIVEEKQQLFSEGKIRQQNEAAPITEAELPFDVPAGWEWARLSSISRRIHYGFTASAKTEIKDVRLLRITDIQNNAVDWSTVPGCEIAKEDIPQYQLKRGDILVARTGGTVGKTFLVRDVPVVAVFASYLIRIQGSSSLYDRYLKFFLESPTYWVQLEEGARGGAQPNVNGQTLGRMVVPVPPLAEQSRIVAKLDQLMTLVEQLETQLAASRAITANLLEALVAEIAA